MTTTLRESVVIRSNKPKPATQRAAHAVSGQLPDVHRKHTSLSHTNAVPKISTLPPHAPPARPVQSRQPRGRDLRVLRPLLVLRHRAGLRAAHRVHRRPGADPLAQDAHGRQDPLVLRDMVRPGHRTDFVVDDWVEAEPGDAGSAGATAAGAVTSVSA